MSITTLVVDGRETLVARQGSGRPLLYLHGLVGDVHATSDPASWAGLPLALADSRDVIAPAHPGWPGSDGAASLPDVEDWAFHLADLLDALGVDALDVVGTSFGAWMAMELAVRHPARVRRMALVAPLGLHVPGSTAAPFFRAVAPRGVGGFGEARRLLFADPDGPVASACLPDDMGHDAQLRWFGGLSGAARLGWDAPHFQSRRLSRHAWRVRAPVLLVWGAADRVAPATHADAWLAALPGARSVVIDDAGHALALEQPERLAREVLAHLD